MRQGLRFAAILIGFYLGSCFAVEGTQDLIHPSERGWMDSYFKEREKKPQSDTAEIIIALDKMVRHEISPDLLRMTVERANSDDRGGWPVKDDLFKKLGAMFTYDFLQHDQLMHRQIDELEKRVQDLEKKAQ